MEVFGRHTALYSWEHYPFPRLLQGKTVEELAEELIPISHNQFSIRKCQKILDAVKADGDKLASFAGIVPVNFSSAGKGGDKPSKQGNRRLQGTINSLQFK